jgi:uncharacterized protein (DUF362 family)
MPNRMHKTTSTSKVYSSDFISWRSSVPDLLEQSGLGKRVVEYETIVIKPNLVEILQPPITTPVDLMEQIVLYLLEYVSAGRIVIGEGCGATGYDTHHAFKELGYTALARQQDIQLIDLNTAKLRYRKDPRLSRWPEMYLPELLDSAFLLSVPQLKAHSLSGVTLTMKNMMGCAPPAHYKGGGTWNKSAFHANIHEAIFELNRYRTPDYTLMDASIGMAQAHLWGPQCSPAVKKLAASFDPVAIDSYGSQLLGRDWKKIGHIAMADGILGHARNYELIPLE